MILQVEYFIWENYKATYKKKELNIEEVFAKIKELHKENFISIKRIGG
jgi:hypothetical protein